MIQVAVVPIGTVPSNVLRDYYSMLLPLHTIPLSAISSFYTEHQKSPFAVQPWDSGSLLFKFVLGGETPSPWEDFQSHRKTLAVIGIIHCPSSPDLDAVVDVFTNACKSEMNEITDSELPCRKAFSISHCEFNSDSDFKYCLEEPSILMLLLFSQKDHDIIRESTLDKVLGDKHQNSTTPGVLQEPAQTQSLSDISAKSVNYWVGTTTLMPLVGRFVADAYTGGFNMVIFSSLVYLMGLSLLILSQFIPSLKPSNNNQPRVVREVAFFLAIYCISLGTGGHKPCLESFGADQFDNDHWEERKKKMSFFNLWSFTVCFAMLLGATVVVYVQDFVSWGVASLIITILMALTTIAFYAGRPFYRYKQPAGNPFRPILQVLVAAIRKRNLSCPSNPALLYEIPELEKSQGRLLSHTSGLSFLDKAAIIEEKYVEQKDNAWRLATVTRVEETKLVLNVVPIWLTSLTTGVCWAQASTLFVKQATTMNLKMTESFTLPPASLVSVAAIGVLISLPIYDRVIVPILRKVTGNERGISILRRISIGMTFSVIVMVAAALVEAKRLRIVGQRTMSVMWLIPQYLILGIANSFSLVGLQEYFYDQVPDSMRSIGMALYLSVTGVGNFLSSFLIIIVNHVTGKNGKSWIGKDINSSRLDRFYWMLAVINALDLCAFLFLARSYTYKTVQRRTMDTDGCNKSDGVETVAK